jgi:hypothetical protein
MKNNFWASVVASCGVLFLFFPSCSDPLNVGAELLDEDLASVGFTDTFQLKFRTEIGDSVRAFSPTSSSISTFLFGRTQDNYFGTTEAAIYLQPLLLRDQGDNFIRFNQGRFSVLDSVVLVLPIDSAGIYGMVDGDFGVEVYEVNEPIDVAPDQNGAINFYSNVVFNTNPTPLAATTFRPAYRDTVFVKRVINFSDTTTIRRPHVRIRLDNSFGQRFLEQDTSVFVNDSTLLDFFKGLYIKPVGTSAGLMNFTANNSYTGIYFYYRNGTDTLTYNLEVGGIGRRISQYKHDYTGSVAGTYIANPSTQDSLIFLQGMQGLLMAFEVPTLKNLPNRVINKAELELHVAALPDYDLTFMPPPLQVVALKKDNNGNLTLIRDVTILINDLGFYFGGQPVKQADGSYIYTFNLSIHTQYLIDGSEPDTVYLSVFPARAGNAARVIFKGPGALENPPILKISFTDL